MGSVTLSMIVKNEEKFLEGCLKSVSGVADEIVIADTGSTDKTLKIAEKYGAKVFHFDWINDFAAARNFALSKSSGDWILYLDADERLSEDSAAEIKEALKLKDKYGARCSVVSKNSFKKNKQIFKYVRFFRNDPAIKFEGKVHEQIEPSLLKNNYEILDSKITIEHLGYDISDEELHIKAERNLSLLKNEAASNSTGYVLFQIGQTYLVLNKKEEAIPYFIQAIEDERLEVNHAAQANRILAANEFHNGNLSSAENYILRALQLSPDQILNNFVAAQIYSAKQNFSYAEKYFRIALAMNRKLSESGESFFDTSFEDSELIKFALQLAILTENKNLFNEFYEDFLTGSDDEVLEDQLSLFNSLINNLPIEEKIVVNLPVIIKQIKPARLLKFTNKYSHQNKKFLVFDLMESGITDTQFCLNSINYFLDEDDILSAEKVMDFMSESHGSDPKAMLALVKYYSEMQRFEKLNLLIEKAYSTFENYPSVISILDSIRAKIEDEALRI